MQFASYFIKIAFSAAAAATTCRLELMGAGFVFRSAAWFVRPFIGFFCVYSGVCSFNFYLCVLAHKRCLVENKCAKKQKKQKEK
uniref:Uncharacterized protein n=1 Tax=Anopheles darlingi TaxID=43151 RepID=A0A2M4D999_ANODA